MSLHIFLRCSLVNPSQVVLGRIQENAANRVCADCATPDPSWGVINLGIMICINCSGEGEPCDLEGGRRGGRGRGGEGERERGGGPLHPPPQSLRVLSLSLSRERSEGGRERENGEGGGREWEGKSGRVEMGGEGRE